ncbi:MAG TPA: NAD(P)H-binding protein, partial [Ktedonobacteraceae bacterium]|nr:NAD(P)H-binding protein [Ktedonobacteraceae bacterium]
MYTVTGASGHLGRLVIKHLLTFVPADQVIATTRHLNQLTDVAAQGVNVRHADFSDPATLPAAFAGTTRLLIISTEAVGQRVSEHKAAIAAAVAAGVGHITYTSGPQADPNAAHPILAEHGQTEQILAASGVPWTALRNSMYAEVLKGFTDMVLVDGQLLIPEAQGKHSWVTREDCALTAVGALSGRLADSGPIDVTGPEALSFADVAQRLSALSGRSIPVQALPDDEIIARVVAKGVPADAAGFMVPMVSWLASNLSTTPTDTVERASG